MPIQESLLVYVIGRVNSFIRLVKCGLNCSGVSTEFILHANVILNGVIHCEIRTRVQAMVTVFVLQLLFLLWELLASFSLEIVLSFSLSPVLALLCHVQ